MNDNFLTDSFQIDWRSFIDNTQGVTSLVVYGFKN